MKKTLYLNLALAVATLSSCSIFTPVSLDKVYTYQIGTDAISKNGNICSSNNGKSLQITRMRADSPFDNNRMAYSMAQYQIETYATHKWTTAPAIMLSTAMQQSLAKSCIYTSVVNSDFMSNANYRLDTQLLTLQQNITGNSSTVDLTIQAQLVDNTTNQVVKSKVFTENIVESANPQGFADGANQANNSFLAELTSWLQ
jgi:cholesterol transport system auxiliary component